MLVKVSRNGILVPVIVTVSRAQRPRDLRRRSTAVRLLGLWVPIPPGKGRLL